MADQVPTKIWKVHWRFKARSHGGYPGGGSCILTTQQDLDDQIQRLRQWNKIDWVTLTAYVPEPEQVVWSSSVGISERSEEMNQT